MISPALAFLVLGFAQQSAPTHQGGETKVRAVQAEAPAATQSASKRILAPQVSAGSAPVAPAGADQAGPSGQARSPVSQVAKAADARRMTPQLAPKGPTAAPPPALSELRQGRDTRAAALEGKDRCSEEAAAVETAVCARVIETRSAEFPVPDREPLSPEQRLMADQSLLETAPLDVNNAARRLSNGEEVGTLAGLAVANLALAKPVISDTKKEDETKSQAPSAVDAFVTAIVQQANGGSRPN